LSVTKYAPGFGHAKVIKILLCRKLKIVVPVVNPDIYILKVSVSNLSWASTVLAEGI